MLPLLCCWCHQRPCNLLHYGGCRVPRSLFFFFLLCPIKSPLRGWAPPLPSSSSFLLPLFFLLLLLGFYLNLLILVFIFVRVTVDLLARAADLLMFITLVNWWGRCLLIFVVILVCFNSSFAAFSIRYLWAFSSGPLGSLSFVVLQAFHRIRRLCFAAFICILRSKVRCWFSSAESSGPLWMLVPLLAFTGKLHGSDNGILQFARGFIWNCASMMQGGIRVCLTVWLGL